MSSLRLQGSPKKQARSLLTAMTLAMSLALAPACGDDNADGSGDGSGSGNKNGNDDGKRGDKKSAGGDLSTSVPPPDGSGDCQQLYLSPSEPHECNAYEHDPKLGRRLLDDDIIDSSGRMSFWAAPSIDTVRGVFIQNGYQHKWNEDDEDFRNKRHAEWSLAARQVAATWGFGYIRTTLWRKEGSKEDYFADIKRGLQEFAESACRPELVNVPIVYMGNSRTARLGQDISGDWPDRVVATASVSFFFREPKGEEDINLPVICLPSQPESDEEVHPNLFEGRALGARWAKFRMLNQKHSPYETAQDVVWLYFQEMIRARLPADFDPTAGPPTLLDIPEDEGWLLNMADSGTIAPYSEYSGDKSKASWVSNQCLARAWASYMLAEPSIGAKMKSPSQPRKWGSGFGEKPSRITSDQALTFEAELLRDDLEGPFMFHSGVTQLGEGQIDGGVIKLEGVKLDPGVHALWVEAGGRPISRPAGLLVLEPRSPLLPPPEEKK